MNSEILLIPALAGSLAAAVWATTSAATVDSTLPATGDLIARGRHLVEDVALCADCHSPRLPTGEFDRKLWLMGAPIGFKPMIDMPWALAAPPIAGLPGYTDEQAVTLLTTGIRPTGHPSLPPMPAFKLSPDEARAVVAYLRACAPMK